MKNWKTTALGSVLAIGTYLATVEDPITKIVGQILMVLGPILFGIAAKDANVTGGTVVQ